MSSIRTALAAGAASLMLLSGLISSASATTVHSGSATGPLYSGGISYTNLGNVVWTNQAYLGNISCTASTLGGTVSSNGQGSISSASFTNCTNGSGSSCTFSTGLFNWTLGLSYDSAHTSGRDGTMVFTIPSGGITFVCGALNCAASGTPTMNWFNPDNSSKPVTSSTHAETQVTNASLTGNSTCGNMLLSANYAASGANGVELYLEA